MRAVWVLAAALIAPLIAVPAVAPAVAQRSTTSLEMPTVRSAPTASLVATAAHLIDQGRSSDAAALLSPVVHAPDVPPDSDLGTAALWLGKAHMSDAREDAAHRAWQRGVDVLMEHDAFDLQLADAYLSSLTPERLRAHRPEALQLYTELIGRVGPEVTTEERAVLRQYVAEIAPMLSDEDLAQVVVQPRSSSAADWQFREGAGAYLQSWWRRSDPMPATEENERLEEHLTRRTYALAEYRCEVVPSQLDGRGLTYLRLGAPGHTHSILYDDADFRDDVFRFGIPVTPHDFPENELWSYPSISSSSYYIFASDRKGCYASSGVSDLLPDPLKQRRGRSDRSENISYSTLMALRYIYAELALFHIDFSGMASQIATYASYQETQGQAVEIRSNSEEEEDFVGAGADKVDPRTVGNGMNQTRTIVSSRNYGVSTPSEFVTSMMTSIDHADRQAWRERQAMPDQVTDLVKSTEMIPIATRTARFLNRDGTTRTEVYWGIQKRHLRTSTSSADPSILTFDAVLYDADYDPVNRGNDQYVLQAQSLRNDNVLVSPPMSFNTDTPTFHLGLQWSQFGTTTSGTGDVQLGSRLRYASQRADSLRALRAHGSELEMSDLRLMMTSGPSAPIAEAVSFPFDTITHDTPLLVYFEVYHLMFDNDDLAQYTVAYEVEGRTPSGWTRLFRDDATQQTSTEAEYSSTSRRSQEYIYLDLTQMKQSRTQDVRVTVRVTDTVSGASRTRTADLRLVGTDE